MLATTDGTLLALSIRIEKERVMTVKRNSIIHLHQRAPDAALEALNRLTGLRFSRWPESLVSGESGAPVCAPDGETPAPQPRQATC